MGWEQRGHQIEAGDVKGGLEPDDGCEVSRVILPIAGRSQKLV